MPAAAMDDDIFRAFRSVGMSEEIAAKLAKIIPRRDEVVTKADLDADREVFAAKSDVADKSEVAILQTKILVTDSAIERIDKRLDRMDARLDRTDQTIVEIKETSARTDEKINSLRMYSLPLLLSILGAIFALLTKGILWGVAP
ncbi:MAG: hypothetical protein OXU71_11230 [Gammaproteobacteria bacterium]|nr:hypothetical protein [Gammaproteobacteria bacterium]